MEKFKTAVIGLGLIGGSLAYALRGFRNGVIVGYDKDAEVMQTALESGAVDYTSESVETAVTGADLCIFAINPAAIIENIGKSMPHIKDGAVITDICGVKHEILGYINENLEKRLHYIGLHPMAGREFSGFKNADVNLFKGAGFIIIPPDEYDESALSLIREVSFYTGAKRVVVNHAGEHDSIIAYTSDLMHIAATALVYSYPENMTMAHTAGAFRDCTRVAHIDAVLWTELLSDNAGHIIDCIDTFINNLKIAKDALETGDKPALYQFLRRAAENKSKITEL